MCILCEILDLFDAANPISGQENCEFCAGRQKRCPCNHKKQERCKQYGTLCGSTGSSGFAGVCAGVDKIYFRAETQPCPGCKNSIGCNDSIFCEHTKEKCGCEEYKIKNTALLEIPTEKETLVLESNQTEVKKY